MKKSDFKFWKGITKSTYGSSLSVYKYIDENGYEKNSVPPSKTKKELVDWLNAVQEKLYNQSKITDGLPGHLAKSKYSNSLKKLLKATGIKWGTHGWEYGKFGGTSIDRIFIESLNIPMEFLKDTFQVYEKEDTIMFGYSGVPDYML